MRAAWCAVGTGVEVVGVKLGRAVGVGVRQSAPGKLISCLFLARTSACFSDIHVGVCQDVCAGIAASGIFRAWGLLS